MIVTTYTCDNCSHSQKDATKPRQMWRVGVTVLELTPRGGISLFSRAQEPVKQKLWCRDCVIKFGLLPAAKDDPTPTPPTFEDLIRDIAEEVVGNAEGR